MMITSNFKKSSIIVEIYLPIFLNFRSKFFQNEDKKTFLTIDIKKRILKDFHDWIFN